MTFGQTRHFLNAIAGLRLKKSNKIWRVDFKHFSGNRKSKDAFNIVEVQFGYICT